MTSDLYSPSDELPIDGAGEEPAEPEIQERPGCGWSLLLGLMGLAALLVFGLWAAHEINRRNLIQPMAASFEGINWLPDTPSPTLPDYEIKVYFIAGGQFLSAQSRTSHGAGEVAERLHQIASELGNRPAGSGLLESPLANGASIRGLYILNDIAYVDLSREFLQPENPSPILERLSLYSFVNSIMLNMPTIKGVQFLIDGQSAKTAWGWMDLSSPLGPDLSLIR